MAKRDRSKEIWHIPKRGNVHQTIYMVYVLSWDNFLGKSWSSAKQEALATELGKAGLTKSGKALTHQSVRTLLANLPKYLGFVFIDESSKPQRIFVTDVGYELIKKHNIANVPKHRNLKEYQKAGDLIEVSEVFQKQMLKLIITNPIIRRDCQNILVFPFRMTLKLLLELDYLDIEEIGYILFHTKKDDDFPFVLERIKNFRKLSPERRTAEINAYRQTEEGKLTLVKAPTAGYYMYLCCSTGLCKRVYVKVNKLKNNKLPAIGLIDVDKVKLLLKKFENIEIYDFKDNWFLWKEYFSNPNRFYPPQNVKIKVNTNDEVLIIVYKENCIADGDSISKEKPFMVLPVFPNEDYKIVIYNLKSGKKIYTKKFSFAPKQKQLEIVLKAHKDIISEEDIQNIVNKIREIFEGEYKGFDKDYHDKLKVIQKVIGKNYFDNRRKGGRLEYLFFKLLDNLKTKGITDEVFWFGAIGKYGICEPAPGGKEGMPDIIFEIDNYVFVLELTTIRGTRAQWVSAEASSVPDHIIKTKKQYSHKEVIGIFSAPSIHRQLKQNLKLNAKKEGVPMLFKSCVEFAELLSNVKNKEEIREILIKEAKEQLES